MPTTMNTSLFFANNKGNLSRVTASLTVHGFVSVEHYTRSL